MDEVQSEVEGDVSRLLAMLEPTCGVETFLFVKDKLTSMVILSVAPPNCRPPNYSKVDNETSDDDFSAKKERFIAP